MKLLHYLLIALVYNFLLSCEKGNIENHVDIESDTFIPTLEVDKDFIYSKKEGGTFSVTFKTNISLGSFRVKYNTNWIDSEFKYSSRKLEIYVDESNTTSTREGCITIYSDSYNLSYNIVIVQDGWNEQLIPNENKIIYTSTDNSSLYLFYYSDTSAHLRDHLKVNSYVYGKGIMIFDIPITYLPEEFAYDSKELETITLPSTIVRIDENSFMFCDNLKAFYCDLASSDNRCLIIEGELVAIAPAGLSDFIVPNSVSSIRSETFYHHPTLKSITIPNSVYRMGEYTFYYMDGDILNIDSPILQWDSDREEGKPKWLETSNFSEIIIGDNVSAIGNYIFYGYESLEKLTIGESVERIGTCALYSGKLKIIYCKPTTPPQGSHMMFDKRYDMRIYVPRNSVEAYKSAKYWKDYADYIEGYDF